VLAGGPGTDVPIPEEQQWGENVSVEGEPAVQSDPIGTTGRVRSVGPVVRGPDGQVSVAIEVDAFTPPPDILVEPITTPAVEPEPVPSRPPVLTQQEIDDIVNWGRQNNRSPEDIQRDLDSEWERRGGSGTVPMPVDLEQVETPNGPVTLTGEDAQTYRDAQKEVESAPEWKRRLRDRMADLNTQAQEWTEWQMRPGLRAVAGIKELWDRQSAFQAEEDRLLDELERLNTPPSRTNFDVSVYSSYEEARRDWESRGTVGVRHSEIAEVEAELRAVREHHPTQMQAANTLAEVRERLSHAQGALANIEQGRVPPIREEYESATDYQQAMSDWETRGTEGRFFDEAQRLRSEIESLEAADRILEVPIIPRHPLEAAEQALDVAAGDRPFPYLPDVEPAGGGGPALRTSYSSPDQGTMFDRPARNLERIAQRQDRFIEIYRDNQQRLEEAERLIEDINSRASSQE